jgi:hypothetical protein
MALVSVSTTILHAGTKVGPKGFDYRGSVWGSTIPLSAGMRAVDGAVIWAGPMRQADYVYTYTMFADNSAITAPGAWNVRQSFAVALGKKLDPDAPAPLVRRIWVNGVLSYNNGVSQPVVYSAETQTYIPAGIYASGIWNSGNLNGSATTQVVPSPANSSPLIWRFYDGNEDQIPDPEILTALGSQAPSYRGLMYMVISDLIVGRGNLYAETPAPVFPSIRVELIDGTVTSNADHNFAMLEESEEFFFSDVVLMANWDTRTIASIVPTTTSSHIMQFDMDAASQVSYVPIADGGTPVGTIDNFSAWDTINDIFYTIQVAGSYHMLSLSPDGSIIQQGLTRASSPQRPDGGVPNLTNPATKFPAITSGTIDYAIRSNGLVPLIEGTTTDADQGVVHEVGDDGSLPSSLTIDQFYDLPGNGVMVFPLNLWKRALKDHLSNQDAAFLVCTNQDPTVELVYVGFSGGITKILGRTRIYDGQDNNSDISAFIDADGHICIQDFNNVLGTKYHRIALSYTDQPDFGEAPGFKGLFPHVGATLYENVDSGVAANQWDKNTLLYSDLSAGTVTFGATTLFTIKTGLVSSLGGIGTTNGDSPIWDSAAGVLYYHNNIAANTLPLQDFTGNGMRFRQLVEGLNGDIDNLGNALEVLAGAAGYGPGDITVDSQLNDDQIVGILIDRPYDLATLFNDLGTVYDFSYFNSAGRLKFERNSNNPLVATGTWTISATPADGSTATIGTTVYRFKTTPSQPFDVKIEANTNAAIVDNQEKTSANFHAAISGDMSLAASVDGVYAGTTANAQVSVKRNIASATSFGYKVLDITSNLAGVAGNSIATTRTGSGYVFSGLTLTGGVDAPEPLVSLTLDDLAHVSENALTPDDALVTIIVPEGQGQRAAQINYYALEQTYQYLSQVYVPDNQDGALVDSSTTVEYDLPLVMSTTEAYARATKTGIRAADNVVMQNFRLPQSYMLLEPTDVITITIAPFAYTIKLDECTFNSDWSTSFSAANYLFRSDVPVSDSDVSSGLPQDVAGGSDGLPVVLDAPVRNPLTGTEAGNINLPDGIRAYRTGFSQGTLFYEDVALEDEFTVMTTSRDVKWGTLAAPLPTAIEPHYQTVEDSIDIVVKTITTADMASGTYLECVEGDNCIAVGSPGNWEYIYFRDVEWLNSKVVRLTGLVRAQRGTDYALANHGPSDVVLLLDSVAANFVPALYTQSVDTDRVGDVFNYQVTAIPATKTAASQANTIRGYELYPFSPCSLAAEYGASSSVDISWVRRDRLNTEYVTNPAILSETSEEYELEILSGSTVVRTVTGLTSPDWNYSSANQTTDGFTAPVATVKVRIYQMGELGRGFPREETLNVQ